MLVWVEAANGLLSTINAELHFYIIVETKQ